MIDVAHLKSTIASLPGGAVIVSREQLDLITRELELGNAARMAAEEKEKRT